MDHDQDSRQPKPRSLRGGVADDPGDPRVAAVLEVLGGRPVPEVARRLSVDVAVLHRWVRDFVDAGTAQVTNRPSTDAAQQRDRFLAAFAHEVRTPLAVAQGWAELLEDDELPGAVVASTAQRLNEALARLAERTLDVQLMAAASMGRLQLNRSRIAVADLVAMVPGAPAPLGDAAHLEVVADEQLLPRVLRDLWEAAQLPPAPRTVRLVAVSVPPWIELRVERDADPIDTEILQALFDPFDLNDDATGITIGLYLARALAVAHGGTIGVDQDDDGAALWVRIPNVPTAAGS